jgi:DNA-binding response OmpR family regulator
MRLSVIRKHARVLIIDDDKELCVMLSSILVMEGFFAECRHDAIDGLLEATDKEYDLVILDVMLPRGDGLTLLKDLRMKSTVPIIMLTARGEITDRIDGLDSGADDYIAKPFDSAELISRMRAVLRRRGLLSNPELVRVGDITLDMGRRSAKCGERLLELTSAEFDLLQKLLVSTGRAVSRRDLTAHALGRPMGFSDRSIDNHMSNLRRKLGTHADGRERIRSIRGIGYCYVGETDVSNVR